MNQRLSIVLLVALVIASGASYTVFRLAAPGRNSMKPMPSIKLIVASKDLAAGALVREADLRTENWVGSAPSGSTTKKSAFLNRGVVSAIYEGEPVTENRLAPAGSGGGLAATIPTGMRACAVRVNEVVGVAGFVIPGMRVDVLITGVPPGQSTTPIPAVKTLLQNIQVLSAGTNIEKDKEGKPLQAPVVNLLVNPHDAEILSLAGNETRIQLILRNPMDTAVTTPAGVSMSELFGSRLVRSPSKSFVPVPVLPAPTLVPNRRAEPPAESGLATIEVLNGPTRTMAKFQTAGDPQ